MYIWGRSWIFCVPTLGISTRLNVLRVAYVELIRRCRLEVWRGGLDDAIRRTFPVA
jgi:hypothetical protein